MPRSLRGRSHGRCPAGGQHRCSEDRETVTYRFAHKHGRAELNVWKLIPHIHELERKVHLEPFDQRDGGLKVVALLAVDAQFVPLDGDLHLELRPLDLLDQTLGEIAVEGRIALYGIQFATGSATIQPESADTLETIVSYLRENPERYFYVVGHTDDVGGLGSNMTLSEARAQAVVDALLMALPAARDRLTARGVGPLSPVATNGENDGRALNRRVELVSTHE